MRHALKTRSISYCQFSPLRLEVAYDIGNGFGLEKGSRERINDVLRYVEKLSCDHVIGGYQRCGVRPRQFPKLDFEGAFNLPVLNPPTSTALVPFANALPGWTGYANGTNLQTIVIYNGVSVGAAAITLITANTANSFYRAIGGNYAVTLDAGAYPPLTSTVPAAIAQTSLVPVNSLSLRFSAAGQVGDLAVSLNGQNIPFVQLATLPNYGTYGCDISAFAGLTTELRFTERPISNPFATALLDDIFFSNQAIPEPSTFCLFGLGALLLGWRLRNA